MGEKHVSEHKTGLFLIFLLDDQFYGIPVSGIREIIPMVEITPVPNAPVIIKGVINLRGSIVPIIDLRRKLKLKPKTHDTRTCMVVADAPERAFGFIADRVTDCLELGEITSPEEADASLATDRKFIHGIGQHLGQIVIILAMENLISSSDRKSLKSL